MLQQTRAASRCSGVQRLSGGFRCQAWPFGGEGLPALAIPDDELAAALRPPGRMTTGVYVGFAGMREVGQLEDLNYRR